VWAKFFGFNSVSFIDDIMEKKMKRAINMCAFMAIAILSGFDVAFAADDSSAGMIAVGAGIAIGLAALGGTLGQGKAASAALESIGRNPSAAGKLFTPMILGLALIESLVILSFVIAYGAIGKI